ncbi:hypothetical protein RN001_014873 [Aquatica leii]|uniref:Alpha-mannosidase n=1 Tax=Aquatica leii TaxID=1421715 RepID=A0AAN7NYJ2_9COLE|nr:hypothetical protein RN001_014873 [Aquatica leii]
MKILILILCLVAVFGVPIPNPKEEQCGYQACPVLNSSEVNVHLIAHSHDDVGWLKTPDQYYYGSRSNIQIAGVQHIITSVVQALLAHPKRKFIQVESAFFHQWWKDQSDKKREDVVRLVNTGQLEIVGGGWSQNDESAAHYQSIIDQMTFGIKYMEDTLGKCARPKAGWQIDPFGHTREMASILAQMGYDGLFFARLDWRDKGERLRTKTAEMLWRSSANFGNDSLLFTHAMYNHYSPPTGFFFDILSEDDPLIPDQDSTEYNLNTKMNKFREHVWNQTRDYSSNNIMVAMGNDFTYQDAHYNFKNLDILIKAYEDNPQINAEGKRIRLFYSTPSCYLKAVNDARLSYKIKTDDFIPYASDYHAYWSGYYTSRPTQKRFERQGNNFLQITKQLHVFSGKNETAHLNGLKSAMGVMQHHDAVTGTEKQHVADDYARTFMRSLTNIHGDVDTIMKNLLSKSSEKPSLVFKSCLLANVSHCEESQKERFAVSVYNPLSRKVSHHVRLPVDTLKFTVSGPNGTTIEWQIVPSISNFADMPEITHSKYDLVFLAKDVPALGVHIYYVTRDDDTGTTPPTPVDTDTIGDDNNYVNLDVEQELMYYVGAQGNNEVFKNRSSGAYIFRPDPEQPDAQSFLPFFDNVSIYTGKIVNEIHQVFNEWNRQIIRIYKNNPNYIEFDWLVGPIDIENNHGKEVISRFTSNLVTNDFYTDSNGREMLLRKNNHRSTYNFSKEEPVAGNYYPITSAIACRDKFRRLEMAVLTDRAQELMVHRRLLKDDAFGVAEALNETEFDKGLIVRGQHYLTFGSAIGDNTYPQTRKLQRDIAQKKILAPWVFVADASSPDNTLIELQKKLSFEFSGLKRDLPEQVQILTLEPWNNNTVLMRFEHVLERAEGGTDVKVDVKNLFQLFEVTHIEETTLAGNKIEKKLQWNSDGCLGDVDECDVQKVDQSINEFEITMAPMKIRTFVATIEMN